MTGRPIVHVATGPSFLDFACEIFEAVAPGANHVIAVGTSLDSAGLPSAVTYESVAYGEAATRTVVAGATQASLVIFHGVQNPVIEALSRIPRGPVVVWSGWGGDYYGNGFNHSAGLLGPLTSRVVRAQRDRAYWVDRAIEWSRLARIRRGASRRADYFSAPVPEDFAVFARRFRSFSGGYVQLNYVSIEDIVSRGEGPVLGTDVLLGNSASPENNHFDVFEILRRQELGDSRLITPLSYGSPEYREEVVHRGRDLFGDRFVPLINHLSLDEYHQVIAGCSVVLMGHYRQQGLGNVLRAVWQGAHVVLDPRNPVTQYLESRGVQVTNIRKARIGELASTPLGAREVDTHRAVLDRYWGRETVLENARAVIARAGL